MARTALSTGQFREAFEAAECAWAEAAADGSDQLLDERELLQRICDGALGDRQRTLRLAVLDASIDPRVTFLISRLDDDMTIDDLLDVSAMPRLEATRLVAAMLYRGTLVAIPGRGR